MSSTIEMYPNCKKPKWIRELYKFPRLLSFTEYPLDQLGCNYTPNKLKKNSNES